MLIRYSLAFTVVLTLGGAVIPSVFLFFIIMTYGRNLQQENAQKSNRFNINNRLK